MSQESLLYIMTAAVVVSAAAIVIQVALLFAMFRASRSMKEQTTSLIGKIELLTETAQHLFAETRKHASEIAGQASELLELSRKQLTRLDDVLGEATVRTRAQMDRIEMVMDDTVNRFQETVTLLQNGIVKPIRQFNAVTAGIRAAIAAFAGGRRTTVEQATHDEEMFI